MKLPRAVLLVLLVLLGGCAYMGRQATIFYMTVNSEFSAKEVEMEMEKPFLERYKNRTTIDATFTIDKARSGPNPPEFDGDIHAKDSTTTWSSSWRSRVTSLSWSRTGDS